MLDHLSLIPKEAMTNGQTGKFAAKLTFEERCAALACVVYGVSRPIVAAAFSINRRTVTHIVNEHSAHYKDTRKKLKELGKDEFIKEYLTESVAVKIKEAAQVGVVQHHSSDVTPGTVPSPRASRCAGINVVQPEQCTYSHRIEIAYFTEDAAFDESNPGDRAIATGWHYRDLDDKTAWNLWLHSGPDSLMTSQACLKAAEANLTDD